MSQRRLRVVALRMRPCRINTELASGGEWRCCRGRGGVERAAQICRQGWAEAGRGRRTCNLPQFGGEG